MSKPDHRLLGLVIDIITGRKTAAQIRSWEWEDFGRNFYAGQPEPTESELKDKARDILVDAILDAYAEPQLEQGDDD